MINIVSDLLTQRSYELAQDQTIVSRLALKNPSKNTKQGAPKGLLELSITKMDDNTFAVRASIQAPWSPPERTAVAVPKLGLALKLQKLLTPLKLLGFEDGTAWTVDQQQP